MGQISERFTTWQQDVLSQNKCSKMCKKCIGCGRAIPVTAAPVCDVCAEKIMSTEDKSSTTTTITEKAIQHE